MRAESTAREGRNQIKRLAIFVLLAAFFSCSSDSDSCGTVRYEVMTSPGCTADVTYAGAGGSTLQNSDVPSGWVYTWRGCPGDFVYVSAQNGCDHGGVTARILFKGDLFKTASSSGAFVIATSSGSL